MKNILYVAALLIFVLFAAFQLNDPDPILWTYAYLYGAFCFYLALTRRPYKTLAIVGAITSLVGAIHFFPGHVGQWLHAEEQARGLEMKLPFIEEAREAMGLGIQALLLGALVYTSNEHSLAKKSTVVS